MNSFFELNQKDLDYNQSVENASSPNPYIQYLASNYYNKEENFFSNGNNGNENNINKNHNFIFISSKVRKKREVKNINKLKNKKKVLVIDINKNLNQNHLDNVNNINNINNINNKKPKKKKKGNKKCGRKRVKDLDNTDEHNKFSDDNIRRKCKHLILDNLMKFINRQIRTIYNGRIGNSVLKKEIKIINQSQISDASVTFNKLFIYKKLCDIFSDNISKKYTNLPLNHNKIVIYKLMNDEDEIKKNYFENLFNLTFIECLKHFIGEEYIPLLDGLTCFRDIKDDIAEKYDEDGEEYSQAIEYYLNHFETIINNKKPRKPRKKIYKNIFSQA